MFNRFHRAVFALWLALGLLYMSRPPRAPEPFPNHLEGATRGSYNPLFAAAVDNNLRDYWQKPDQVLESLGDLNGLTVADIGCGEGYFTLPLLQKVGPSGRVFATDINKGVLDELEARIPAELRDRAQLILAAGEDTGVPQTVDLILLVQVFGEVDDQDHFLESLLKIMDDHTRLVIIDSKHITDTESGFTRPRNLAELRHRLSSHGLAPDPDYPPESFDFLPKQFFFVLKRAK